MNNRTHKKEKPIKRSKKHFVKEVVKSINSMALVVIHADPPKLAGSSPDSNNLHYAVLTCQVNFCENSCVKHQSAASLRGAMKSHQQATNKLVILDLFAPTRCPPPQVRREYRASCACSISRRQALPVEDVQSLSGSKERCIAARRSPKIKSRRAALNFGAGDGNRTHVTSLEGWNSTIELRPQIVSARRMIAETKAICNKIFHGSLSQSFLEFYES